MLPRDRAAKGQQSPHSYFSMAIDGMDQNKTDRTTVLKTLLQRS